MPTPMEDTLDVDDGSWQLWLLDFGMTARLEAREASVWRFTVRAAR